MSERAQRLISQHPLPVLILVALVAAVSGLVGGYYLSQQPGGTIMINGQPFYSEQVNLPPPPVGSNLSSQASFLFHAFNFTVELQGYYSPAGGRVVGAVSQPNGTTIPFVMYGPPSTTVVGGWVAFVSPGGQFAVEWNLAFSFVLLVHTGSE